MVGQIKKHRRVVLTKNNSAFTKEPSVWHKFARPLRRLQQPQRTKLLFVALLSVFTIYFFLARQSGDGGDNSHSKALLGFLRCDIFFLELTGKATLDPRHACSIESAALHHPNRTICLLATPPIPSSILMTRRQFKNIRNVAVLPLDLDSLFPHTPLDSWWSEDFRYASSPWRTLHLSDATRLALLYAVGGLYLDLDVLLLRDDVFELSPNFVGVQYFSKEDGAGTAVMKFSARHPFLAKWLAAIPSKYDEGDRGVIGPRLLTSILIPYCQLDVPEGKKALQDLSGKSCDYGLRVLEPKAFYPLPWTKWKSLFDEEDTERVMGVLLNDTGVMAVHTWNELSHGVNLAEVVELAPFVQLARTHCPMIYYREIAKVEKKTLSARELRMILKWSNGGNINLGRDN